MDTTLLNALIAGAVCLVVLALVVGRRWRSRQDNGGATSGGDLSNE